MYRYRSVQAATMYLQGVRCEESGQVVEAIKHYKRAMQLVPDIEKKMYKAPRLKKDEDQEAELAFDLKITDDADSEEEAEEEDETPEACDESDDSDESTDLFAEFQKHLQQNRAVCTFKDVQQVN